MVHQINLKVSWLLCLPIDAVDRDSSAQLFLSLIRWLAKSKFGLSFAAFLHQLFQFCRRHLGNIFI